MYLEHFRLSCLPFGLTPDTQFFCDSPQYAGAIKTLLVCLSHGEGFIKITGEVGSGKTLLCRLLLNQLEQDKYVTAYIPNPHVTPQELPQVLAKELQVAGPYPQNFHEMQEILHHQLIQLNKADKNVVLLIDEAQAMPLETLEALRLITNLETEKHKLLQVVLFGQPELDDKLNQTELRQLKQRIAFSFQLKPLSYNELQAYIRHRLAIAGHTHGNLFTPKALKLIAKYSHGIPRVVNILCHKSLLAAFGLGLPVVNTHAVKLAKQDTDFAQLRHSGGVFKKITRGFSKLFRKKGLS